MEYWDFLHRIEKKYDLGDKAVVRECHDFHEGAVIPGTYKNIHAFSGHPLKGL
jgi:hypothetical protein